MSMNVGGSSAGPMCDINTMPLIDVLPVLLVNPQPEIHLNPDGMADVVAKVLASAQRNRMTKIGFVNTSEFSQ